MKRIINADPHGKIMLQGCDPVAFHTVGKAIKDSSAISTEYQGYNKYLFSSKANKAMLMSRWRNICRPMEATAHMEWLTTCCFR
jgi:hypothetical protein